MTGAGTNKIAGLDISVVIPALNAARYLPALLQRIESQTAQPREIVIVDSSKDRETEELVSRWHGPIPLVYCRLEFAYPGHARNVGVETASGEWVAFLDCRTVPVPQWLEHCCEVAAASGAQVVRALTTGTADTFFKENLLAATYGNAAVVSLAGSIMGRDLFKSTGGFLPQVRAGEDVEWMNRLTCREVTVATATKPLLEYQGFPASLGEAIRKWHIYTNSNARIDVINTQKVLYSSVFATLVLLFIYRWNYLFACWNTESLFFVPNITKGFLAVTFLGYLIYRGLVRPLRKRVELSFLLPWRWLAVSFIGLCLDLAKAPGLILGAVMLITRKLALFQARLTDNEGS